MEGEERRGTQGPTRPLQQGPRSQSYRQTSARGTRWAGRSSQGSGITIPTQVCVFLSELDHSTRLQKLQRQATSKLRVAEALSTPGKGQELVLGSAGVSTKAFIFQAKFELSKGPRKKSTY